MRAMQWLSHSLIAMLRYLAWNWCLQLARQAIGDLYGLLPSKQGCAYVPSPTYHGHPTSVVWVSAHIHFLISRLASARFKLWLLSCCLQLVWQQENGCPEETSMGGKLGSRQPERSISSIFKWRRSPSILSITHISTVIPRSTSIFVTVICTSTTCVFVT